MGTRGPVPKRSAEQLGHRTKAEQEKVTKVKASGRVPVPAADKSWHPLVAKWYRSLKRSAQSQFYEPSDWMAAQLLAESMSRELKPQPVFDGEGGVVLDSEGEPLMVTSPPKGASLAAWLKGMTALMVTEGDRRRVGLEIVRAAGGEGEASVTVLDEYRDSLGG